MGLASFRHHVTPSIISFNRAKMLFSFKVYLVANYVSTPVMLDSISYFFGEVQVYYNFAFSLK